MASTRRGRRVILCMGNMRKECMARDWHTGDDSSMLSTSRKRGLFSLCGGEEGGEEGRMIRVRR